MSNWVFKEKCVATFANTLNPTPFGAFDTDVDFQTDADSMVTFVKRKLGDDILSVELTKKQVWACFEEAFFQYGQIVNEYQARSQISTFLGTSTGSLSGSEQKYPRDTLEFLIRQAEPYAFEASIGGSYNSISGSITLEPGRQDYDLYDELKDEGGNLLFSSSLNKNNTRMKIQEVFHFNPQAAYRFFDTTSAINYLNNEFSFESFTPETIFYVLPVFEDILRAGQMNVSHRVRRSNYYYKVIGTKIRIFPMPTGDQTNRNLWVRVGFAPDPLDPPFADDTIFGVSNLSNVPFGDLEYSRVNSIGRQWVRQYTLALSTELLGHVRSKFSTMPIPNNTVQLDGSTLVTQGRDDKKALNGKLREMLESLTYDKIIEMNATKAENIQRQLKTVPIPNGRAITMG
tara:strand:- start:671 stop:1873 length:1203 start_codon:yes stop_codon:yes gene_type:complete